MRSHNNKNDQHPITHEITRSSDHELTLSPAQSTALQAILSGKSYAEAAHQADIDPATLWSWRNRHVGFRLALSRCQAETMERIQREVSTAAIQAIKTLTDIAGDPDLPSSDRVRAAIALLSRLPSSPDFGPTSNAALNTGPIDDTEASLAVRESEGAIRFRELTCV